jgi:hypothetical protein
MLVFIIYFNLCLIINTLTTKDLNYCNKFNISPVKKYEILNQKLEHKRVIDQYITKIKLRTQISRKEILNCIKHK